MSDLFKTGRSGKKTDNKNLFTELEVNNLAVENTGIAFADLQLFC